jgi:hypothetical protein
MPKKLAIREALELIFAGIRKLSETFPERAFTIDGRLVGDLGEVIATLEYEVKLHDVIRPDHDADTLDGRQVQIKATFKNALTFKVTPECYLGFKLYENGEYEEVYNGPGHLIFDRYKHRKGIGQTLLSFPVSELRAISSTIPEEQRIPRRSPL